ncbi:MAG: hypothetical protein LBI71_11185 [Enterobacteriaceae bacterium]|jgi:hypothetical protein|nr:hypothetical protein [Enterobacteriaceae bacterium]
MNLIVIIKDVGILDENIKGITTPIVVAILFWIFKNIRKLLYSFVIE